MLTLNRKACEAMLGFDVHGCTDVTGFGLIGHAREMALASGVTIEIDPRAVRFLPGAEDYARQGAIPGGLKNNREFAASCVEGQSEFEDLLYDPQTSGGLLIALPEVDAQRLEKTVSRRLPNRAGCGEARKAATSGYFVGSAMIPLLPLAASLAAFIFLVSSAFWTHPSAVSTSFLYWSGLSSKSARSRISRFMYAIASS